MKKGMLRRLGAFAFAAALTLSSVTVMAKEPAEMSTSADLCITDEETGITLTAPSGSEDIQKIFDGIELKTEKVNDEEQENDFKDRFGDKYAEVELYNVEIRSLDPETLPDIQGLTETAKLSIPLSEEMNSERTKVYSDDSMTIGSLTGEIETTETGTVIIVSLKNDYFNTDKASIICQYAVMRYSIPTEVKDWGKVVDDYIWMIRYTDWFTGGDDLDGHFYIETPPADDAAVVTTLCGDDYGTDGPYYNPSEFRIEIPYEVFAADAAELFVNVPDMRSISIMDTVWYEASVDAMCRPLGGGGNAPLVTEVVKSTDLGDGRYAIQFKVSNMEIVDSPDMSDENDYTKCTLTVEDNGKGDWKYVSFEAGYTEGTSKPENPGTPSDPTDPTDPSDPTDPADPSEPTDPKDPSKPENPVNPSDPADKNTTVDQGKTNTAAAAGKAPQTGDTTDVSMYLILMTVAAGAVLTVYKKKHI